MENKRTSLGQLREQKTLSMVLDLLALDRPREAGDTQTETLGTGERESREQTQREERSALFSHFSLRQRDLRETEDTDHAPVRARAVRSAPAAISLFSPNVKGTVVTTQSQPSQTLSYPNTLSYFLFPRESSTNARR